MKQIRTAAVCAVSMLLAGCGSAAESGEYRNEITLVGQPISSALLPANTSSEWDSYIISNLYTGLTRFAGPTGRPSRGVAAKIETTDQITWTITLQRGWTFHDGSPVTPQSFIRAWNFAADGANGMQQQGAFANIAGYPNVAGPEPNPDGLSGLAQTDTNMFTVTLIRPDSQFETRLATAAFSPLPDSFFEPDSPSGDIRSSSATETDSDDGSPQTSSGATLVGNGPFVAAEVTDRRILLTRNSDFRSRKPLLTEVEFVIDEGTANVLDSVEQGVIQAGVLNGTLVDPGTEDARISARVPGTSLEYLVFPMWDSRFADKGIRQAFSTAIDRDQILAREPDLMRTKATSWTVPNANGYSASGCGTACVYNAERARTSLATGGGFTDPLIISYAEGTGAETWVDAVCISISNTLEVSCTGNALPEAELAAQVAARQVPGPFVSTFPLPEVPDVAASIGPLYLAGAPLNSGGYANPEFDTLFNVALAAPLADATPTFRKAQQALGADLPSIPLWYPDAVVVKDEDVEIVELTPFHFIDLNRTTVR